MDPTELLVLSSSWFPLLRMIGTREETSSINRIVSKWCSAFEFNSYPISPLIIAQSIFPSLINPTTLAEIDSYLFARWIFVIGPQSAKCKKVNSFSLLIKKMVYLMWIFDFDFDIMLKYLLRFGDIKQIIFYFCIIFYLSCQRTLMYICGIIFSCVDVIQHIVRWSFDRTMHDHKFVDK